MARTRSTIFWRVVLPASLPGIFTGIRVAISIGVTMLVGAELTATSDGIAWMALTAAEYLSTDIVLVGVLIMAIMGYTLDRIVRALEAPSRPLERQGLIVVASRSSTNDRDPIVDGD